MKKLMFISLAFATLLLVSCGNNKKKDAKEATNTETTVEEAASAESSNESTAAEATQKEADAQNVQTINLTGNDKMQFNKTELTAKAGQKIKLTMKNVGSLPASAMSHDVVILKPGSSAKEFGLAATKAGDLEKLSEEMKAKMIIATKMLGPGESDTITFTLSEPGVYPFVCSFAGHYVTMNGTITVE